MYIQLIISTFFITLLYILMKIGLKYFCCKDVYKLIFPIYVYLYIRDKRSSLRVIISVIHVSLVVLIAVYFWE